MFLFLLTFPKESKIKWRQDTLSKQMMKNMEVWEDNINKATNKRILEKMVLHAPQTIKTTSTQDLDPLPLANNNHPSVLPDEMYTLEPGDTPSRTLPWKPLGFLSHVKRRFNDDRFPLALWEVWFALSLGYQYLNGLGLFDSVLVMLFKSTILETTCRRVKQSLWLHRYMTG
jgi:hypothetical protein